MSPSLRFVSFDLLLHDAEKGGILDGRVYLFIVPGPLEDVVTQVSFFVNFFDHECVQAGLEKCGSSSFANESVERAYCRRFVNPS